MEFNAETVASAIHQFYSTNDEHLRSQLNSWLLEAQNSVEVWRFAWTILNGQNSTDALQLFAANCLYQKLHTGNVVEYLNQFGNSENFEAADAFLRQSLIDICHRTQSKVVKNKMALALSAYVCYSTPDIWPDSLEDLSTRWRETRPTLLLDFLAAIPRESGTMTMNIERRAAVRGILRGRVAFVADTVSYLLQLHYGNADIVDSVVNCIESWVDFCNNAAEWVTIVAACLQGAVITKGATLSAASKFFSHFIENTDIRKMENFVGQLFDFLAPLINVASNDEDYENILDMCVALFENHTTFMLEHLADRESIRTLINHALALTNAPGLYPIDETNSGKFLRFWRSCYEEALAEQNTSTRSTWLNIIEPIYTQLSDILLRKLKYPPQSIYGSWSAEDKELFDNYRADGGDAIACCYRILAATQFLDSIVTDKYSSALQAWNSTGGWEEVEVILYALESIGDYLSTDHPCLRTFFGESLANTSLSSNTLANTASRMITKYANIISEDGYLLKTVWEKVVGKLISEPATVREATTALETLVRDAEVVLSSDNDLCSSIFLAAYGCFSDSRLQHSDRLRALYAAGYVLAAQPNEIILNHLNGILAPRMQRLQDILKGTASCTKDELLIEFDVLTCLISTLGSRTSGTGSDTNPAYLIVAQSFGLFQALYSTCPGDPDLVNKIVETLKRSLTILTDHAKDLAAQFCQMVVLLFPPNTSVLPLAKTLFLLFAGDEALASTMVALFRELTDRLSRCETEDGVESYLSLCQQLAKKRWQFLTRDDQGPGFEYAVRIACQTISSRAASSPAVLHASQFLCEIFSHSDSPAVSTVVQKYGESLMTSCVERLRVELLHRCVECVADVMFNLMKFNRQHSGRQQQNLVTAASNPVLIAMMKEVGNLRKFREFAKQYNTDCRRASRITGT